MNSRRLYRCRHDRQLAGVAAGMAEYLDLDPTVVRILWILSAFVGGFTIVLYIILAFVMPLEPIPMAGGDVPSDRGRRGLTGDTATRRDHARGRCRPAPHEHRARGEGRIGLGLGIVLVVFGAIALIGPAFPGWVPGFALGPAFLVALGVALVIVATRRRATET